MLDVRLDWETLAGAGDEVREAGLMRPARSMTLEVDEGFRGKPLVTAENDLTIAATRRIPPRPQEPARFFGPSTDSTF